MAFSSSNQKVHFMIKKGYFLGSYISIKFKLAAKLISLIGTQTQLDGFASFEVLSYVFY